MGKLIGKTIAVTLAAFIGVLALVFGILALACPKVIGNAFSALGSYPASVYFYERQFEKTGDMNDLVVLVKTLDEENDAKRTASYCKIMIDERSADFTTYYTNKGQSSVELGTAEREYFYVKYALAELNLGDFNSAMDVAYAFVKDSTFYGGYTQSNPYRVIIYEKGEGLTVTQLESIATKIATLIDNSSNDSYIQADIKAISNIISNKGVV